MLISKLASAIKNDLVSGLRGLHNTMSLSEEQLEDEIIEERLQIIKEYALKGIVPIKDLLLAVNCIEIDCKDLNRCPCKSFGEPVAHFEIPQIVNDFGMDGINYIGSTDRQLPFTVYYSQPQAFNYYNKYRRRGKNKPTVYLDSAPNKNGMIDGYIFNAPLLKMISVVAVFKDPRQLEGFGCCKELYDDNYNFLTAQIKERLTKKKLYYYRQLAAPILPNTQQYEQG